MNREKLANIQWQWVRNAIWISLLSSFFIVFLLTYGEEKGLILLISKKIVGIPLFLFIPCFSILIGSIFGYVAGSQVKKRMELLTDGTMALERGDFSYRISDLGVDEVGQMGRHLNMMASRVEEQVASLQRLSTERAELQEKIKESAVNEERQRLARDLHDAVSQQLFAISMMTSAIPHTIQKNPEAAKDQIEVVENMAATAQSEMRALLLHLRPARLEGKCLHDGIEELLIELKTKQQLNINWNIEKTSEIPKGIEDHLFRIVQEAVSNILRHAKATRIDVQLAEVRGQLRLKIIDNGIGFNLNEQKSSSYGLQTMKERVNEIGGVLEVLSMPGKGTQIEAKVPIIHNKEEEEKND